MKCPSCQHENRPGAKFCEECATPLARTCSNCGTALSATAKFCHACAHPVAAGACTPSRSPDSYTPKHLAEKILTSNRAQ
jgi:Double zinc ribbon